MSTSLFINLPVADLAASIAFYNQLGFATNPAFTNDQGAGLEISPQIKLMLLTRPFFQTFTHKALVDANSHTEVLLCLSQDSRSAVDDMVQKALAAGGTAPRAAQDHGFMYGHGFEDLDGHIWELVYMES